MGKVVLLTLRIFVLLICWQITVWLANTPEYILPSPLRVFEVMTVNIRLIMANALITFTEALVGFLIANFISVLIAIFIALNPKFEDIIMPLAIVIKTIPVIALTPLLIIWFGSGPTSKIVMAILICFFPALVNVLRGIKSLDRNLLALFKIYNVNRSQLVKMLILPGIRPYLFAALKVSSSLAVIGALVGEFIGSNKGLGFLIISNYYNMNTAFVFASIIVSASMGIIFYYTINLFEKKLVLKSEMIA